MSKWSLGGRSGRKKVSIFKACRTLVVEVVAILTS